MKRIRYILIQLSKKNTYFRLFLRKVLYLKNSFIYNIYKFNKVDNKLILFESFNGKSYADSPRYIYEYMLNDIMFKDYKFVWFFTNPCEKNKYFNDDRTIVVKHKSSKYYKYFAKSKYWIVNSLVLEFISKKKNQVYIQTWHGTPLKKLRCDIEHDGCVLNTTKEIKKRNNIDVKRIDFFLSPSKFCTKVFISAFNLKNLKKDNIIVESGYPRNEKLFKSIDINKIKSNLGINKHKKVIMYAPTFRDNEHKSGLGYTYKLNLDFDKLKEELEDEYIILFRTHYFIANNFNFDKYKGFIYNVSNYDDVNDLYLVSDILITDYSSVFFDYANLGKPILFYMYDLDLYKNRLRDFYIDLNELPGPIYEIQENLIKGIKNIKLNSKKYINKYIEFNKTYNYLDNENASKQFVNKIFKGGLK